MRDRVTHALLAIGVNRTPGATNLRYAERDAMRFGLAMTSARGAVPPSNARYFLGTTTTREELDRALDRLAAQRPTFLMVYFGGHGNAAGIAVADGLYHYNRLRGKLEAIGARAACVVLNTCQAGGMVKSATAVGRLLEASEPNWTAAMLSAVPGMRILMASEADASTYENQHGGVFVNALLAGMFAVRRGDYTVNGVEYVSDLAVFSNAHSIMRQHGLTPIDDGVFGDFPMMLSNSSPAGEMSLYVESAPNLGLIATVHAADRRYLPTKLVATATDAFGNVLAPQSASFLPMSDNHDQQFRFGVDLGVSPGCQQQLWQYDSCRVIWTITVLDAEDRVLDRIRSVVDYNTGRPLVW